MDDGGMPVYTTSLVTPPGLEFFFFFSSRRRHTRLQGDRSSDVCSSDLLAALGSASAETMESLIAWRALQGASLGAGVMCARAMVRDLFAPHLGAQVMSKALTGLGVIAFLSPVSGSLLVDSMGWRSTMLAKAVMGALALLLVALRFTETLARTNPTALQPLALARNWITIVRHPGFQSYQLLTCCTYAALFTNLAASSFTYIHVLGVSRTGYGLLMGSNAL